MALFENEREANLRSSVAMVEQALGDLGKDVGAARSGDAAPRWTFQHGSATITVALISRDDFTHLYVTAPVMIVDAQVNVIELYRHLLALHATDVHGAAFATHGDEIRLVADRSTIDLDLSEVHDIIKRVSDYADYYDNRLIEQFGGRLANG